MNLDVVAFVVLVFVVVAQQLVIFGLINRVLLAKGVSPLHLLQRIWHDKVEPVREPVKPKPLFTVPIG